MRKVLGLLVGLSVLLFSSLSFAKTVQIREHIAERYMLIAIYLDEGGQHIDESDIKDVIDTVKFFNVEQLQIAIYDNKVLFGNGMRAVFNGGSGVKKELIEKTDPKNPLKEEMYLGYSLTSQRMVNDFLTNPAVAEDIYKNHTILLDMKIATLAHDSSGTPYVEEKINNKGHKVSIKIYLSKKDSFLPQLKTGKNIVIRGRATSFSQGAITLQGKIVAIPKPLRKEAKM